eukprot:TRINITY_DN21733_c0_g1_i1.p1 TRINITY_DN21733_c0_g1~~TRINITY_DN21733_c0_g1_i1.p1  ORF type:complete len:593 (+),score=154.55 TRINITY_DN21733_c0_g1_i1:55-1779(+)
MADPADQQPGNGRRKWLCAVLGVAAVAWPLANALRAQAAGGEKLEAPPGTPAAGSPPPARPAEQQSGSAWREDGLPGGAFRRRWAPGEAVGELRRNVALVKEGPDWGLFCYRRPTFIMYGSPSLPRCYAHRRKCARPGGFKVFGYPLSELSPGPGTFLPGLHRALRDPDPASPLAGMLTDAPSEACVFLVGVDTFLFGHYAGQLSWAQSPQQVGNRTVHGGDQMLEWLHPHGSPPFRSWLSGGPSNFTWEAPGGRPLWGLNHFSFAYSDWGIDSESFYKNRGMLPVRSSSTSDAYQRLVDLSIPLPKISRPAPAVIQASREQQSSSRPLLIFFSGASYSFASARYQLRLLRELGDDIKVFIYCYEKYKKKRSGRVKRGKDFYKWEAMRLKCLPETNRAVEAGFMPDFQKAGGTRRAPTTNSGKSAEEYQRMMRSATFCIIVRGWGIHSYRLTEALQLGCIPVVLQPGPLTPTRGDETYIPRVPVGLVMPMNDTVDWSRVAVFGTEDEVFTEEGRRGLVERLRKLKSEKDRVDGMQRLGFNAHDAALGGDGINASMRTMLTEVLQTWRWRAWRCP